MLNYTVTCRWADNNPLDNILEYMDKQLFFDIEKSDLTLNSIAEEDPEDTNFMTNTEILSLSSVFDPEKIDSAITERIAKSAAVQDLIGEPLAALGSNAV